MSGPSAFSTDNDTGPTVISETVVISKSEESPGSKYSKQDPRNSSGLTVDTDLSARVRQGSSVSVELSARPERSVGDLVMEDRGHRSLPGMVSPPTLTLQPRVAQARPQPPALPPPPPLLKIPSVDHPSSIPSSSSGPSSLPFQVHQTPIQARYNNLPLQRRSPPGSELRSHLIDLLQAPPQTRPTAPASLPQIQIPRASSLSDDSAHSSDNANGDSSDRSNALKCREYREKNKVKRREEEMEFLREQEKNDRLREIYSKTESDIKKLKEYYMDFLRGKKCMKRQCRKKLKVQQSKEDTQISPLVMVKAEIEFDADVLVKSEQVESNPAGIASC